MTLFLSEEEYDRCSHDVSLVAEKADAFIRELYNQLETVRAQADAASITAEQTCSLLEQKYVSLSAEFSKLESQNAQLNSDLERRQSELAQVQSEKHQIHLISIEKDGNVERLSTEVSELHKSKRQLLEILGQKESEINEKNATIQSYLDKIVNVSDNSAAREARMNEIEAELARANASCSRLSEEKELILRHNTWLNDELTAKVNNLIELRKEKSELEADMSAKIEGLERNLNESLSSLKWNKERVGELESKLTSLQEDLASAKDSAAVNEQRHSDEIFTVTKLVELYKETSEEWSKKAGELEGVIKALETHLSQMEHDYKEKLEKEVSTRKEFEKEAAHLKEKLEKCEAEMESSRKASELNLLPLSSFTTEARHDLFHAEDMAEENNMVVPHIPTGVSGTALAASLIRDGWSLAKMYAKYQEAVDALRHEQLGRKQSQAILERVLYEIEEKAGMILDERAEHERLVEAYSVLNQKLQHSLSEQSTLETNIQELKADLKRHEREYSIAQREITDLEKEVTVLLKECRDIQLRCGSGDKEYGNGSKFSIVELNASSDTDKVISERLLTFKDINGLVEQNVQLRSLVRTLSDQVENREMDLKEKFELELQKRTDEAATKVNTVLERTEEQGRMIESLHTSVAMYKRLYEEEHKLRSPYPRTVEAASDGGAKDLELLLQGSQEAIRKAQEEASDRARCLEEDLRKLRAEMLSLRSERDKLALEANFAREKLDMFMKEFEHQRNETNGVLSRNVEFSQLIIDYQRKLREGSESVHAAEEHSRKLSMEVSVLKHEKEILSNSEKRAFDEVRSLSERVYRLQASLDMIQSADEVREEARRAEKTKQENYVNRIEKEWAQVKNELREERDNVRRLTADREETMKNAMRQVEHLENRLANALSSLSAAETRAAVAEARCSEMEKKLSPETKATGDGSSFRISSTSEPHTEFSISREEFEKLKDEFKVTKEHMVQYKSIAQVNEAALKQMEISHENFKNEADKVRTSLEAEISSHRERVKELEIECSLKSKEAASAAANTEASIASAVSEIDILKEELSIKKSQIEAAEIQISSLTKDLEKEHQKWRDAQTNYERQVILQSETIQELTKTSQALGSLQEEVAELRKFANGLEAENNELKAKWDVEKSMLEESKSQTEKKYIEINEQNKILHSRLEALHINIAEGDRSSAGLSRESTSEDPNHSSGLQNVVSYLRRSKEIAETEISLLKQEKLRLQSQLESALKAAEKSQASLNAERSNSRATLFTDEEFKGLQIQVREVNLLRESNMQLREENKHNFEECQKLRHVSQNAREECEKLEALLREGQIELEASKKEIELQKIENENLRKRVDELIERCKNISVEDYDRMREDIKKMQESLSDKDAQLGETKKLVSGKEDTISELKQELAKSRAGLSEMEKLKKSVQFNLQKRNTLTREKDELIKANEALSKQLEDYKLSGRKGVDAGSECTLKEARIQTLEKLVDKLKEDLKKERDDHRAEKAIRQKTQRAIVDTGTSVNQEKIKILEGLEKHKQALKALAEEVEKLKNAGKSLPEGTSVAQILSATPLDPSPYLENLDTLNKVLELASTGVGAPATDIPPIVEATPPELATGQTSSPQAPRNLPVNAPSSILPGSKPAEERAKRLAVPRPKMGRKLVRPVSLKPEERKDAEMTESEPVSIKTSARKRLAPTPSSELQEDSIAQQQDKNSDVPPPPVLKKSKPSEDVAEEEQPSAVMEETVVVPPAVEEKPEGSGKLTPAVDAEAIKTDEKEEQEEESKADETLLQPEGNDMSEEVAAEQSQPEDEDQKVELENDMLLPLEQQQQSVVESESEREEGEMGPEGEEDDGNMDNIESQEEGEIQPDSPPSTPPLGSPSMMVADEEADMDILEPPTSPQIPDDEGDLAEMNIEEVDNVQATSKQDENPEATPQDAGGPSEAVATSEPVVATQDAVVAGTDAQEAKDQTAAATAAAAAAKTSRTINLIERAKENARRRQAGASAPPAASTTDTTQPRAGLRSRGRGVVRSGRGHSSGGRQG